MLDGSADLETRGRMQLGAALAGSAIENSMLGAAHATANPLTARFDLAHGHAVALMLPHVVRLNSTDPPSPRSTVILAVTSACRSFHGWRKPSPSRNFPRQSIDPAAIPELAEAATHQWTGRFNPVPLDAAVLTSLYRKPFHHEPTPRRSPDPPAGILRQTASPGKSRCPPNHPLRSRCPTGRSPAAAPQLQGRVPASIFRSPVVEWTHDLGNPAVAEAAVAEGAIVIGDVMGNIHCIDIATRKSRWSFETGDTIQAAPAISKGRVFVGSGDEKFPRTRS